MGNIGSICMRTCVHQALRTQLACKLLMAGANQLRWQRCRLNAPLSRFIACMHHAQRRVILCHHQQQQHTNNNTACTWRRCSCCAT